MKFGIKKAEKFGWEGVKGWSVRIEDFLSASYLEVETEIPLRKNTKNDRVYFVIEGEVSFTVNGKKNHVNEKEAIFIPKNTKYSYKPKEKVRMVEANVPPFDKESEIVITN